MRQTKGWDVWSHLIYTCGFPLDSEKVYRQATGNHVVTLLVSYSVYVIMALLFSTARRRNGYSGLHDLAVGSRVILKSAYQSRLGFVLELRCRANGRVKVRRGPPQFAATDSSKTKPST